MLLRLDHIAIAVPDLERAIHRFADDLGIPLAGRDSVPTQKTTTAFFPIPGTRIELVHPLDQSGPIQAFLDKRGGGLHHLCFATDDLEGDVETLRAKGYQFITPGPVAGAHNSRVIFIHPKSCDGVLIELVAEQR